MKETTKINFNEKCFYAPKLVIEPPFKRIRDENYDFRNIQASTGIYSIHPYPAMFHFLVVRKLIFDFSKEDDYVLDPFMGSGVVAGECLINKRNFIGYDINPLAVLIAKVRTNYIKMNTLLNSFEEISKKYYHMKPELVDFHNIQYWFYEDVINNLSKLRQAIFSIKETEIKDFFKVVFSETVRKVSRTKNNEFKLFRRKDNNYNSNVINTFKDISLKNIGLLSTFYKESPWNDIYILLKNKNIIDGIPIEDNFFDLVVTSPPYGDSRTTVAYGQFSRLSLRWLGLEENVDKTSLGSKPKDIHYDLPSSLIYEFIEKISDKDEKRGKEVFSFYVDLSNCISLISKKVKNKGYVCFVVGNRRVKGIELPTDKISADFFENEGFKHEKTLVRAISNKRMPAENSPSNIKGKKDSTMRYEYIMVLQKDSI